MAKNKPAKKRIPPAKDSTSNSRVPLASTKPEIVLGSQVCEALGVKQPREFPPPPVPQPGYTTMCDPGLSVLDLHTLHPLLFYSHDWYRSMAFAKRRDHWKWRQIRITPVEPGKPFDEQWETLLHEEEPTPARALVTLLIVQYLVNIERPHFGRLRCADLLPSGQRVLVCPFGERGIEFASCSDQYASLSIGLSAEFTFETRKK